MLNDCAGICNTIQVHLIKYRTRISISPRSALIQQNYFSSCFYIICIEFHLKPPLVAAFIYAAHRNHPELPIYYCQPIIIPEPFSYMV